jgi:protein gp37
MGDRTAISWTEATWNPVTGCTEVSEGCDHCYARSVAHRFAGTPAYPRGFEVTLRPERLDQPLRWRRPRMIFVNSMSDLFHAQIPDGTIAQVFAIMALAPTHTFQVPTSGGRSGITCCP